MTPSTRQTAVAMAHGAADALAGARQRLNDLNVYPVPDGDTGSNLARTAAKLAESMEACPAADRSGLTAAAKRAALAGASGNSGIILSQIVAGFVDVLGAAEVVDGPVLARALREAATAAYRPVQQPIEGTMLTVIREMAEAAEELADQPLEAAIDGVLAAGAESVSRTQSMLPVLAEAGVVDAGAAGLVEFARGAAAGYRGDHVEAPQELLSRPLSIDAVHQEESRYRYCTTFMLEGEGIDRALLERELEPLGDCLLVVGELPLVKVHVHTDDPGRALSIGSGMGSLDGVEVANMHEQARQRERRLVVLEGGGEGDDPLTPETAGIVLDSTADLPRPQEIHANWRSVPLTVAFGDQEYADGVDLDVAGFYDLLARSPEHPRTAAPAPAAYGRAFAELAECRRIFVLPISSRVSGSHQAAAAAAQDDPRVTVLDGLTVSAGTVLLAEGVQRLLESGTSVEQVTAWVEDARQRMQILIAVDTLEFLHRGGRVSRAQRVAGGALGVRPLLTLREGEVVTCGKVYGRRGVWRAFEEFLRRHAPPDTAARVGIAHGHAEADAQRLVELVGRVSPQASIDRVCEIGPVVGTHGGPGTLGLLVLPA
ncbi:MAG TPA: DegV family protein [Gaiellales bacterium]|nr:DegV family protein [Gaiellales bacterium]